MSNEAKKSKTTLPEISPYVFTALLAFFGIWCFYDGWLTSELEMQKHLLFNRVCSSILIPWAAIDFFKVKKKYKKRKKKTLDS